MGPLIVAFLVRKQRWIGATANGCSYVGEFAHFRAIVGRLDRGHGRARVRLVRTGMVQVLVCESVLVVVLLLLLVNHSYHLVASHHAQLVYLVGLCLDLVKYLGALRVERLVRL